MLHVQNFSCFSCCKLFPPVYPSRVCCTSLEVSLIVSNGNHTRLIIVCTVFLRSTQTQANEKLLQQEKNANEGGVVGRKEASRSVSNGLYQLTSDSSALLTCTKGSFQSCVKNDKKNPNPKLARFCLCCNSVTHAISGTLKVEVYFAVTGFSQK